MKKIEVYIFSVKAFQSSKFDERETKNDRRNFEGRLTVTFKVKNL